MSESTEKKVHPAQIRPETKQALDAINADLGTAQIEILARVIEWFHGQSDAVKLAVMRRQDANGEIVRAYQARRLTAIAAGNEGPAEEFSVEECAEVIRQMVAQIERLSQAHLRQAGSGRKSAPKPAK